MELREARWYCVRSHRKREHVAEAHLRLIPGVDAFNPQLRLVRRTRRGRMCTTESLFPTYLFACFVLEDSLEKVRYMPAVKEVLEFGGWPPSIPSPVIEELRLRMDEVSTRVFTDSPLEGDEVEINGGPFEGFTASVARVLPGKERVQVLLDMMGRSVQAELSLDLLLVSKGGAVLQAPF